MQVTDFELSAFSDVLINLVAIFSRQVSMAPLGYSQKNWEWVRDPLPKTSASF